jgi:hypothetical protein
MSRTRCSGVGTHNPLTDECSCPLTRHGRECELSHIPACHIADGMPTLRPLFWLMHITQQRTAAPLLGKAPAGSLRRFAGLGPLPCQCVREMLSLAAPFRSRWADMPSKLLCAIRGGQQLSGLLNADPVNGDTVRWAAMDVSFADASQTYTFSSDEASQSVPALEVWEAFGGLLLPLRRCPSQCNKLGWCIVVNGQRHGSCRCFPDAVRTRSGGCMAVTYAEPFGPPAASDVDTDKIPGRHARTTWGVQIGEPMVGRAADGSGQLHLFEASSARVAFNFMRCLRNCSARGACDLQGFCACESGSWGLDCGLTRRQLPGARHRRAVAGSAATAPSPRIFVYDLDVWWRGGPQLLAEYDMALTERLLSSEYREAEPEQADYFWIPGPNLRPGRKLDHIRRRWPSYWNRSTTPARHVLTLLGERAAGDTDLASKELVADLELSPSSARRKWFSLSLNGMGDFRSVERAASDGGGRGKRGGTWRVAPCHVCFQSQIDVVIPPPAATTDVPTCRALRDMTTSLPREAMRRGAGANAALSPARDTLFFWAGRVVPRAHRMNPVYASEVNVREAILAHRGETDFHIVNSYVDPRTNRSGLIAPSPPPHVDTIEWMRRSTFCWVPPGQRYGDARRHILAAFLGCIPVFSIPDEPAAQHTLGELLAWDAISIEVPLSKLAELPDILRAIPSQRIARMRRGLECARKYLWYATIYGACADGLGGGVPDAFDGLMRLLASRLTKASPSHSGSTSEHPERMRECSAPPSKSQRVL